MSSNDDNNTSSTRDFIEQSMKYLLCRIYLASQMMELGSESRFTSIILFHRYVCHFEKVMHQKYCQHTRQQEHQNQKEAQKASARNQQNRRKNNSLAKETKVMNSNPRVVIQKQREATHKQKVAILKQREGIHQEKKGRRVVEMVN